MFMLGLEVQGRWGGVVKKTILAERTCTKVHRDKRAECILGTLSSLIW